MNHIIARDYWTDQLGAWLCVNYFEIPLVFFVILKPTV
jgi:hypothetical protein